MVDVDQYYRVLELEPGASRDQVKQAYRDLAYVWHPDRYPEDRPLLRQKAEEKLKQINSAYEFLRSYAPPVAAATASSPQDPSTPRYSSRASRHSGSRAQGSWRTRSSPDSEESRWDPGYLHQARLGQESAIRTLIAIELASQGIKAQVNFRLGCLRVTVDGQRYGEPVSITRTLTTLLNQLQLRPIQKATVTGTLSTGEEVWRQHLLIPSLPKPRGAAWLAFDHLEINTLAFPIALVVASLVNQMGDWGALLPHTGIHDLGHLMLAWFSSRLFGAGPDPLMVIPPRSWWLYGLTLLVLWRWGLMAWRERWVWQLGGAGALIALQFWLTFLVSETDYALMAAWAGAGGELIFGMMLMIGFQVRLPFWWRWRAWRYPVLLLGACLYWQGFERWHGLGHYWGLDWPAVLSGGTAMAFPVERLLLGFGWSPYRIIQHLAHLSELCGVVLIGVYVYGLSRSRGVQQRGQRWMGGEWQRWWRRLRIRLR